VGARVRARVVKVGGISVGDEVGSGEFETLASIAPALKLTCVRTCWLMHPPRICMMVARTRAHLRHQTMYRRLEALYSLLRDHQIQLARTEKGVNPLNVRGRCARAQGWLGARELRQARQGSGCVASSGGALEAS
jgi:hypothetical protein